ncbi:MAG: outer membrane protein assembly factor BamE [Gammaproteobacteria bacterium]
MILNNLPGVYTIDVQQGNIVDQAMVDQLRPGMSKRQVLYIMGSPILKDVFHENRWEYLYSSQPGGEARQQKRITLYFEDDKIVGLQGDFRPSKLPVIKPSPDATVDVPKRNLDESLWGMLTGGFSADDSAATPKQENAAGQEAGPAEVKEKSFWETFTGWFGSDESVETAAPEKASGEDASLETKTPDNSADDGSPTKENAEKTDVSPSE